MDNKNEQDLIRLAKQQKARIIKLLELVPDSKIKEVPDPYYTGNFDEVYDMVTAGSKALLEYIRAQS
ncbi:Low molecular weight protein-tyrosine-phosphatase YfkJ [compost metagenome]